MTRFRTQCTFRLAASDNDDGPRWIQIAAAGTFKGHILGKFTLGAKVFEAMIRNFRGHPSYKAGPDGVGCADVVPFDFEHAIETTKPADHAQRGVPAQAWAQELDTRLGEGGRLELWALCRYLETAREYVRAGAYKWTSMVFQMACANPVTGKDQGPTITSIAFTNNPFIQGMQPIAASQLAARYGAGGEAIVTLVLDPNTLASVTSELRYVFDLPATTTREEIVAQLTRLGELLALPEAQRGGVDAGRLVGRIRRVLNLPVLTEPSAVMEAAHKAMGEQPANDPEPTPMTVPKTNPIFTLAAALRVPHGTEDEMQSAIITKVRKADDDAVALGRFLKELGADDIEGALKLWKARGKLIAELEPEVKDTRRELARAEKTQAEADVEAAIAAHRLPGEMKDALLAYRGADIALDADMSHEQWKLALDSRVNSRERFAKKYPVSAKDKTPATAAARLMRPVATYAPGGQPGAYIPAAQLTGAPQQPVVMSAPGGTFTPPQQAPLAPPPGPAQQAGVNPEDAAILASVEAQVSDSFVEKCRLHLKTKATGQVSYDDLHDASVALAKRLGPLRRTA